MKISIVTASLNQGNFIGDAFESVLNQQGEFQIQYIVVDGMSTDNSFQVIKKYQKEFKKKNIEFLVIREKDHGQADAINKGFKKANGEILAFLNSDDYYSKNAFLNIIKYFQTHPETDWVFGGWNIVNRMGKTFATYQPRSFEKTRFQTYGFNIGQPSCFFRRTIYKKMGPLNPKLHLALDYDLWLRFLKINNPGVIIKVISNMRYYSDAKSAKNMVKHNHEAYTVAKKYLPKNLLLTILLICNYMVGYLMIKFGKNISQKVN